MPIYEYECDGCGCRFERRQSISDEPVRTCPECEGAVRRLIHPVGVVFKGSGFYVTDNRPKSSGDGEEKRSGITDSRPRSSDDGGEKKTSTTDSRPKSGGDGEETKSSATDSRPKSRADAGDKKTSEVASAKKDQG